MRAQSNVKTALLPTPTNYGLLLLNTMHRITIFICSVAMAYGDVVGLAAYAGKPLAIVWGFLGISAIGLMLWASVEEVADE